MNTKEIAEKLVAYCNAGEWAKPYVDLYSQDIISVEHSGGEFPRCEGMNEVAKKGIWWEETFEIHKASASEPLIAGNWFTLTFTMDTTHKPSGMRSETSEVAVYQVKDGKIVYEEFFYNTPGE